MNSLGNEENLISVDLMCVTAYRDEQAAAVLVSNKQSFLCDLL